MEGDEENCRVRDESLEFAVLGAATEVARARAENLCMRGVGGSSVGVCRSNIHQMLGKVTCYVSVFGWTRA